MILKKLLAYLSLTIICTGAQAEWSRVGAGDNYTTYVDTASLRKNNNIVKIWTLDDFKTAKSRLTPGLDLKTYFSSTHLLEFDCKEEYFNILYSLLYEQPMAKGEIIDSDNVPSKSPVVPGSVGELIFGLACGNR